MCSSSESCRFIRSFGSGLFFIGVLGSFNLLNFRFMAQRARKRKPARPFAATGRDDRTPAPPVVPRSGEVLAQCKASEHRESTLPFLIRYQKMKDVNAALIA